MKKKGPGRNIPATSAALPFLAGKSRLRKKINKKGRDYAK